MFLFLGGTSLSTMAFINRENAVIGAEGVRQEVGKNLSGRKIDTTEVEELWLLADKLII